MNQTAELMGMKTKKNPFVFLIHFFPSLFP